MKATTVPLGTEYLYRDNNQLTNPSVKQGSEITAFERMSERLKNILPSIENFVVHGCFICYAIRKMEVIQKINGKKFKIKQVHLQYFKKRSFC